MRKRCLVIGGVFAATLLVLGALGLMWLLSDTPGMEAMKSTGMVGYTPTGATRTFLSETQEGTDFFFGVAHEDEARWGLTPASGSTALHLLREVDRAAERAGFTDAVTPLGESTDPLGRPGTLHWFQRHLKLPGIMIGLSAQTSLEGTVDVVIWVDPAYYR